MRLTRTVAALCLFCWSVANAGADPIRAADVAADFSSTSNPAGVWSYGWSAALGSPFILSTSPAVREGLDTWRGNRAPDGNPALYHNGTNDVIVLGQSARYEPGQFGLHPGPNGEYAIARYVAPATGNVSIRAVFASQDFFGTTTDVHVLLNGASLFDDVVEGALGSAGASFGRNLKLGTGDVVDFAVGFGRNGSFFNDSTSLAATVNPVPEPSTLLLTGVGSLLLARSRRTASRRPSSAWPRWICELPPERRRRS